MYYDICRNPKHYQWEKVFVEALKVDDILYDERCGYAGKVVRVIESYNAVDIEWQKWETGTIGEYMYRGQQVLRLKAVSEIGHEGE